MVGRALAAHQAGAIAEHEARIGEGIGGPPAARVDGRQVGAVLEHGAHRCHLGRVEAAQVNHRQVGAVTEHDAHVGHVGRVEVAQIKVIE